MNQVEELFQLHINPSFLSSPAEFKFNLFSLIFSKTSNENSIKIKVCRQKSAELIVENTLSIEVNGEEKKKQNEKDKMIKESYNTITNKITNEIDIFILSSCNNDSNYTSKKSVYENNDIIVNESNDISYEEYSISSDSHNKINGIETEYTKITKSYKSEVLNEQLHKLTPKNIYNQKFNMESLTLENNVTEFKYEPTNISNKVKLLDPLVTLSKVIANFIEVKSQWNNISNTYHRSSTYYHVGSRYWVRDLLDNMYKVFEALHSYNIVSK